MKAVLKLKMWVNLHLLSLEFETTQIVWLFNIVEQNYPNFISESHQRTKNKNIFFNPRDEQSWENCNVLVHQDEIINCITYKFITHLKVAPTNWYYFLCLLGYSF